MSQATEWLLTSLLNHGSTVLGTVLFLAALGIPLPATLLLLAAGAFVRQGVFPAQGAALAAVTGAIAGDACSYLLGRFGLRLVPAGVLAADGWGRAVALFDRWGGWGIFVTRFLLTPMALPVNLLAGSTRYAWTRFLLAAVSGEVLWVLLFGGLGHAFAGQWEALGALAGDALGVLAGAVLVAAGLAALVAGRRRRARAAALQPRRG